MASLKFPKGWEISERDTTSEEAYLNRRESIRKMGFTGLGAWGAMLGGLNISSATCAQYPDEVARSIPKPQPPYPVARHTEFKVERPLTVEEVAASYNNFYEFTTDKGRVWRLAEKFETRPWEIEVTGQVRKRLTFDIDDLMNKFPLEERVYRFRCVEAWSMVVPWTGFPLKKLIDEVQPLSAARYIRFVTFFKPEIAPGQKYQSSYPWPYYEGLTMQEAVNKLTMLVTGIYGHALPNQHGAPIRIVTPWKYGYKSIKSIVRIEFVRNQPPTFWNDLAPNEYDFYSNVNPKKPHPRWSQATERVIDTDEVIDTLPYNGYEEYVAHLYPNG